MLFDNLALFFAYFEYLLRGLLIVQMSNYNMFLFSPSDVNREKDEYR
jgi:hypothetical protein